MDQAPSKFFNEVIRKLAEIGQSAVLTADERDIVDDYELQDFGVADCAMHIERQRIK